MDCKDFEQIAAALVDGELGTDVHSDARRHVASCPRCLARVEDARAMKTAIGRVFPTVGTPESLVARVRGAIEAESQAAPVAAARPSRWTTPLAMAAALAFLWLGSVIVESRRAPEGSSHVEAAARWVSDVQQMHAKCIKAGPMHHDDRFSLDLDRLSKQISDVLGLHVVVPDLSAYGFRLQSADTCGIGPVPGAHLIYEHRGDGALLSLFTVARQAGLASSAGSGSTGADCFVCEKGARTVVAWHASDATYVFCGGFEVKELVAIVEAIR
jgi:anti-sigma factor RsiW